MRPDDADPDAPALPVTRPLRLSELSGRAPRAVESCPEADARAAIAAYLGIDALPALRFKGTLTPEGRRDWVLRAQLAATIVQGCVVTLQPVESRIDTPVLRRYLADWTPPQEIETEIPQDDTLEPLGAAIDPAAVMIEALALALPLYPRAEGAELGEAVYTEPGKTPMRDEDARPFAGLGALRDKLARGED